MFSLSQFDKDDLFQSYKRQTYLIAFPLGILLIILYVVNAPMAAVLFYPAVFMAAELFLFTLLIWWDSNYINTIELIFYFSLSAYFFLIIQITISHLLAENLLTVGNLSEQLNGLCMWLLLLLFGAFFTVKPEHTRLLIVWVFIGILAMFIDNVRELSIAGQLTFSFIFRWINPFSCLALAVLLVQRMGKLQQSHASTDALTGLLNRHALYHVLAQEVEKAIRLKKPFSIILFDIDQFKAVNDTFGHLEGDKVLGELSKLVAGLLRATDFVGRWGGEEFLVVLTETDTEAAHVLAQRFRVKIEETRFLEKYSIAASFGVATYEIGGRLQDLLESADIALYQAKDGGRNQVVVKPMTGVVIK